MQHASRDEHGVWTVELDTGETRRYDALLVANGHHWDPRWPEPAFAGTDTFPGLQLHAHSYVDNSIFAGKRVVVLGMGNSAMDIAVESSYVAERTYLAARQGVWIIPKYVFGKPVDQMRNDPRIPFKIRQRMIQQVIRSYAGPPERYGLPKPNHRFGEAHPTVSGRILDRIAHGDDDAEAERRRARGRTGALRRRHRRAEVDVVVYCTGYKISFPFFDEDFMSAPDNDLPLFRRVFQPDIDNLAFIGLLQPLGAIMPLAEAQGHGLRDYLLGEYALPARARHARGHRRRAQAAMLERYVASKRHTIQVDYDDYLHALAKERRTGGARARANGYIPPASCRPSVATTAS